MATWSAAKKRVCGAQSKYEAFVGSQEGGLELFRSFGAVTDLSIPRG